ncbi:MAG TPA: serine/threonine-protein kinase [Kofleriaceae bacterium]
MTTETTAESRLIGTVTGGYRVLAKIGSGTMGHVYEAQDIEVGKRVALKVLHKNHNKELAARFLREGKTLALLSHPNIVQLVDMGQLDDGTLFLATELIPGGSLRVVMDRGAIEPRRALAMVRQLLDALDAAHALGVVHRDIKPENVMLAEGDVVKVLDFGVAKLLADTVAGLGEANLTSVGFSIFGSALYIAPESVTGQPIDARIDIYSTGAMLFEMLAGRPPFDDDDPSVLLRKQAFEPPPTLAQVAPALTFNPELEALVACALAKQPGDRFACAADMSTAVDAALRSLEPKVRQAAATTAPSRTVPAFDARRATTTVVRRSKRWPIVVAGAGAALVLGLVVAIVTRASHGGATNASTEAPVAAKANELVRAGSNREAVALLERELAGPTTASQASAYLALGHARFALGDQQQALAAYERALRAAPALGADSQVRTNLLAVLDGKDSLATILALDLLVALTPPERKAVASYASTGKLADARRRALMIAEREGFAADVDRTRASTAQSKPKSSR